MVALVLLVIAGSTIQLAMSTTELTSQARTISPGNEANSVALHSSSSMAATLAKETLENVRIVPQSQPAQPQSSDGVLASEGWLIGVAMLAAITLAVALILLRRNSRDTGK